MKNLFLSLLCLASSSAIAQQWIAMGGTSYNQYYVQENSFSISSNDTLSMTVKTVNSSNNIVYANIAVLIDSCKKQQGTVTSYSMDGKNYVNNLFVLGGKDAPSLVATAICLTYHNYTTSKAAKSVREPQSTSGINLDNTENNWQKIAINDKSEIAVKLDSFKVSKTKNSEDIISLIGRNIEKKSNKVTLVTWSVTKKDCIKQQGKLTTINIDEKDSYDNIFVFGGGSLGSIISEYICKFKS